jgi:hypothetical protein
MKKGDYLWCNEVDELFLLLEDPREGATLGLEVKLLCSQYKRMSVGHSILIDSSRVFKVLSEEDAKKKMIKCELKR